MSFFEQLQQVLAGAVAHFPDPVLHGLCGGPCRIDGQTLDAGLQLGLLLARTQPTMDAGTPEAARRLGSIDVFNIERIELPRVEDFSVSGPAGAPPVRVRFYRPPGDRRPLPALVYCHGGGFVIGSLDSFDRALRLICRESGCALFSIDYRLAPEHKFPAALEDATAAYRAIHAGATERGIDPERIGVGGDSAGGTLAVGLCLAADRGELPRPRFQALIYPWLDGDAESESRRVYGAGFGLTNELIRWFIGHAMPAPDFIRDERAAPLRAAPGRFAGLPPALILLSGFDPLRDDGRRYCDRLREAGVPARLNVYESLTHGVLSMGGAIPAAKRLLLEYAAGVRELANS